MKEPKSPSKTEVLQQLSNVLRSQVFRNSEMLRNFLSFIVQEAVEGNNVVLKQYSIATKAFKRNHDFDPTIDPIVRIQASRLRRNLDLYFRDEGKNDIIRIELPKGTYIPKFSFAQPIDKTSDKNKSTPNSIVIFPLKNLSKNKDQQFIVDGFYEELVMEISRYSHLEVIRVKDQLIDCTKLSLSRFSMEGSIRFGEDSSKISVKVSDNFNNHIIWSDQQKFDTRAYDLIQLQENLALTIAQKIGDVNGVICKKLSSESNWDKIQDRSAYDAFLYFHEYNKNPSEKSAKKVLEKLNTVVHKEPEFGPGFAVLANIYTDNYIFGLDPESLVKALEYGKKAVDLQNNTQICHLYYAFPLMVADRLEEAEKHAKIGHSLNQNTSYYTGSIGWLYCLMNHLEVGFQLIRESMKADFQYPKWFHLGTFLYYLDKKDYNKMLIEANMFDIPGLFWSPLLMLVSYHKLSQHKQALQHFYQLKEIKPDFLDRPKAYIQCLVKSNDLSLEILEAFNAVLKSSEL